MFCCRPLWITGCTLHDLPFSFCQSTRDRCVWFRVNNWGYVYKLALGLYFKDSEPSRGRFSSDILLEALEVRKRWIPLPESGRTIRPVVHGYKWNSFSVVWRVNSDACLNKFFKKSRCSNYYLWTIIWVYMSELKGLVQTECTATLIDFGQQQKKKTSFSIFR